jgi:hypothetical protein
MQRQIDTKTKVEVIKMWIDCEYATPNKQSAAI